jgi:Ran GTPase-activating protein (RanGAP) involved in mRNA processing and transport
MLQQNRSLKVLDLSWNQLSAAGVTAVAVGLGDNQTLEELLLQVGHVTLEWWCYPCACVL